MKSVVTISRIKQGEDMNREVEDPTRDVEVEVDTESQSIDVTLVTNLVIDPMSALTMKMLDKKVIMLPKENRQKYKYWKWIMHLRLGKTFL